jgi:hypothetical protein
MSLEEMGPLCGFLAQRTVRPVLHWLDHAHRAPVDASLVHPFFVGAHICVQRPGPTATGVDLSFMI